MTDRILEAPGSRSGNIDILRAIAALGVLEVHASSLQGALFSAGDRRPAHLLVNTGADGVWLFFVISGYLIAGPFIHALMDGSPLPGTSRFAAHRVARIWPAYVVALTIVITAGLPKGTRLALWQYPVHYLLLHNLVPGQFESILSVTWTLSLEALFYAAVPAVAWLVRRWRGPVPIQAMTVACAVGAVWLASVVWMLVGDAHTQNKTGLYLRLVFPAMLGPFCPGMLVAVGVQVWRRKGFPPGPIRVMVTHRRLSLLLALAVGVAAAYASSAPSLVAYDLSRELFSIASGIVLVLALTRPTVTRRVGRILAWLGLVSYGIYLWQGVIGSIGTRFHLWVPLPHPGVVAYLVHVIYLFALTVPVAAVSWYLLEHPIIEAVRKGTARRTSGAKRITADPRGR